MAKARNRNRIVLHLNTRMALEAIFLKRLESIPQTRRQEWLRSLLVQGFRAECQLLRQETDESRSDTSLKFSGWLSGTSGKQTTISVKQEHKAMQKMNTNGITTKPFAELSRIIG